MKLTTRGIALVLSLMLLLAGCSGNKELTSVEAQQLLTNDYEVEYIFVMAGLPVNSRQPTKDAAGTLYFPVDSDKYKTVADLQKLLDATYIPTTSSAIMTTTDADGALLYADVDGKLCRSASPLYGGSATTLGVKSVKLAPQSKDADGNDSVTLSVPELSGDTEVGKVTLQAVNLRAGWRLVAGRFVGPISGQSPGGDAVNKGSFADTAQQFLDALVAGDAAMLKELATTTDEMGMWDWSQVSFDFLAGAGVTEAAVVAVVREDERDAEYTVSVTADGSSKVFPKGVSRYRMGVSVRQDMATMADVGYSVASLWNEADPPYIPIATTEPNPALEQVSRLINLFGMIQFDSPSKLSNDVATEYLLAELVVARPELSEQGYSLEDMQAMAVRLLGMSNFTPVKQFYSDETQSYLMWGRGGLFSNCQLRVIEEANGLVKVEAMVFADPLYLNHTSSIVYTMKNNWNGTYELISGVLVQE